MLITTKIAIYIILSIILLVSIPSILPSLISGKDIRSTLFVAALFVLLPISGIIATYNSPTEKLIPAETLQKI